jgi:hypothetical protein
VHFLAHLCNLGEVITVRSILSIVLLLIVISCAIGADKSAGGFAVHIGAGDLYGGAGGATIEYQVLLHPRARFSPFLSGGQVVSVDPEIPASRIGFCLGVTAEFGGFHRLFAGTGFGTHYIELPYDSANHRQTAMGPSFVMGYKGTARIGILWQIYGGLAYIVNSKRGDTIVPAFGVGIGYKF